MGAWNMFDPDYCENRCPVCTNARKGNSLPISQLTVIMWFR